MPLPTDPEKRKYMFSDDMKFVQKAVVFHPEKSGVFLILKRSLEDRSRAGEWDLPGGNVHYGELHEASILKEISEETGLTVRGLRPIHVKTDFDPKRPFYYLSIKYACHALSDNVTLSHEHSEYKWVIFEEFKEIDTAGFVKEISAAFLPSYG